NPTTNVGYDPVLTGTQTTPTPYYFAVNDVLDAGDDKKLTVLTTDVHAGSYYNPNSNQYLDRQFTHFDGSDEFYFEFDTSSCGTGSNSCWYTSSYYFYNNWVMQHTTVAGSGYNGMASSSQRSNLDELHRSDGGYLTTAADDGPGMNLLYLYDSGEDAFAMVGIGSSPSISEKLSGGSSATNSYGYGYTKSFKITLGSDYGGQMGKFSFGNATGGAGTNANRLCVTSNGFTYFMRSPYSSRDQCSGAYYYGGAYSGSTSYAWAGWALGMGYYGRMAASGDVTYKVGGVAPTPDTFSPDITHAALADSHSKSRTISASISDAGDPPSGLNVSTTAGVGPTMYYRVTPDGGSAGSWTSEVMSPGTGTTRAECVLSICSWSADIDDLERGDSVEYYMTAQDVSTVSSGINTETTSTESFSVGDPNKMFVVEWRDMQYTNSADRCSYQAVFYDVTNEIEFKYDDACTNSYDAATVGFMDQTRTKGQTIRHSTSTQYITGTNPHTNNYRISTDSGDGAWESFDRGMTGLVNADASAIIGSSGGTPSGYYCASSWYWNTWKSKCADNIAMPEGFNFTYFGTDYNHTDSNDRIHLGRHGNMHFIDNGATSIVRSMTTWYGNMPQLPYSSSSFARAGLIAPYWSYYGPYYCYQSSNADCGVYYRTMPFEGKGTDVTSDITQDTTWDLTDSPIRINPSSDYLTISADLTIEAGTVIQVGAGKGISFDGACDQMTINGNSTDHVLFEGQSGADWIGMAFTAACSTGTDDRHVFSYVDFKNTSDAAIAAGSRHGSNPSSNGNVGNFTMDHVTFTNVGSAFSHGSGQGTVVSMNEFDVNGADGSCFNFAENSVVSLTEGTMENCNTDGGAADGAIVNVAGSTTGSLFLENTTITNAYVNLIDVDLEMVTVSNVTATATSAQSGDAIGSAAGAGSEVVLNNFDTDDYASVSIDAMSVVMLTTVDFGTAAMSFYPGGSSASSAAGASGDNAVFDDVTGGSMMMRNLQPGTFDDVSVGDLGISGTPATSTVLNINNLDAEVVTLSGCGWNVIADSMDAERLSSNGCSAAQNTIVVSDSTITHTDSTHSAFFARYTDLTIGETAVTSTTAGSGTYLAETSTNSDIRLIEVTQDGNDCADTAGATGDCDVDVGSSTSEVWYGGLATVRTYRVALVGGSPTNIYKGGHTVTAAVVDGSSSELFEVGSHVTDTTPGTTLGSTNVWVITGDESGNSYGDHNLRAFGPAGQNETMTGDSWYPTAGFTIGSSIDLLLEPAPVDFDQAGMDCAWMDAYVDPNNGASLPTNGTTASGHTIFEFDGTPMTLSADLNLDGCKMILKGSSLKVKSTATSSPVLTLSNGGSIAVTVSPDTGAVGSIRAISSSYGLHLDIVSGSLILDGGTLRDVAQDTSTGAALMIGDGATLQMMDGATIYGSAANSDSMATVKVDGGTVNIADSSIINNGQTGTALWVEAAGGSIDNIVVKNAAVGIQAYNGAPQIDGFTATDNVVGVDVYGGMSLPTLYRSTLLSGQSTGWTTYKIDLSTYLANDYLQVGWNSIYGGGNAHPTYNYATSKYYMITDRYNIELEDDAGNAWNITDSDDLGYYPYSAADPASGDGTHATYTTGASGGVPSWNCNSYGYSYGPNYPSSFDGYFYYIWQSMAGTNPGYPGYYSAPAQFGFDWENIDGVSPTGSYAYYPYHYWGYYYTSYHGGQGVYKPPEGYAGSYNVCLDYAYSYYMSAGQGARLTMPMIDVSASNISKVSLYIDVLHNRADNFQDRLEFVARSSNSVTDLIDASYVRESGTPLFKDGIITGADTGVVVGGAFAAAHFQDITVTNPTNSGMEVSGQVASTVDGFDVTGGDYGVLVGNSASGSLDLENIALDGQNNAGVYYAKDITGTMSGSVVNSAGAAFEYGQNTGNDVIFDGISISSNAVGIETSGDGDITMTDVTMGNTKDVVINSAANVDFIEGTVDSSSVDVLGTGMFTRMRQLDVTLTADGAAVTGATVTLVDGDGASAGNGITDSSGIAQDLTYVTATVDSTGLNTPSLAGYEVMSVAEVEYYYTSSSDNTADFRYASQGVTLTDASGNAETVALTTQITERVCWYSTNTAYTTVSPCKGTFSTSGTRNLDDGNGGTINEYGYFAGLTTSQSNKVIMLDTPYMYLKTNQDYDFNGSTLLSTGAYDYFNTQRWYSQFPYGAGVYMNDASVYGVASDSSDGSMYGVEIGYYGSPITNIVANNTVFSNVAKIEATNGYKYSNRYWEIEDVSITNSSISHFQGYQQLNNAIQYTDICLVLGGGDGAVVSGNTFNDCGVGVMLQRSAYYNYHTADEWGADNATISNNVFNDGGEIADIWLYSNGYSDDAVITGNTINSGSAAVAAIGVYNGQHKRMTISDNTINAGTDGIYVSNGVDYHITGNTINGAGDAAYAGMSLVGGYGDVDNNTLVDADGGLILDSASAPPAPTTSLCSIGRYSYSYGPATCTVNLAAGKTMTVNIETDSWGYEASITLSKPDGTTQSWPTWTFNSNSEYTLGTYTDSGNYTLTLRDSYGDGGTNVFMVEGGAAGGYSGPMIADNSITSSPGRTAPSAVGVGFEDCSSVSINSARNTVTLSDNAMVISNCDVSDTSSVLQGQGDSTTVGIDADDPNGDLLTLTGTTIAGFATGVEKTSGELTLTGDASISGDDYGAYVDDATVVAINAAVNGGSTGTGLHVVDSDDVWVYPMNASGLVGMYVENSPFRWDGGTSTADTTLEAVESIGSVENMTWSTSTVQIDAGSNAYVTSIGNTITASKLNVASSATIDEANLFTMGSTHLTAAPSNEVAMLIQSTDGARASYVSTSFQPEVMVVDGDDSDWNGGNALNPSGYAMPGVMSGDATNDMMVTYIEGDDLYIGLTGEDLTASDVLIYLSVDGSGSSTGYNLGGAHTLPFQANYVLWADSDSSFDLYSYGFLGWGPTTLSSANVDVASSSTLTEISIPFSRIGGTPSQIDIVAIVQGETTADVSTVHPTQTIDSVNTLQSFSEYMTVELTHDDLSDGAIADEVLVYRSYKGSNTPSVAKNYDVMIKTEADCEYDWATATDLSLATNVAINLNMARACPEILSTLADITVTEDSAAYTFSLTNLVDDVQDLEADLTWASSDSNLVAFDDNDVVAWNQNGQTMTITPLADQFGTLEYDFVVTDSHGLTDSQSITFEVTNVNDAPVICNVQEVDCMPIISTDQLADGTPVNNILAEGFGSWTKFLGDVSNASSSYIRDMANEQSPDRQSYDWSAAVDSSCVAFGVEVDALNNLVITENTANEKGGMCTITLDLSDNGNENTDATSFVVDFSVAPVNDAPVISLQDANGQNLLLNTAGDRATGEGEYISMTEDDTNADNLTWDLLPLMSDIDHDVPTDHTWTVEPTSQCTYTNYFTTAIVGTDLVFTLIPDATTNGYDWEVDYMNDNGIHQLRPNGQTFCAINLVLKDTATAPSHTPNYDNQVMPIADYQQGTDDVIMYVTVERVAENVADYSLDDVSGINFNGITNIMTGTYIPVSVNIDAGGDEGPYNYDHMLAVTFHTDGHSEAETTKYYNVPDYGTSITVNEEIFMTKDTTKVEVSMDVLTCLDEVCDLTVPASERFQADDPTSHRSNSGGSQGSDWSAPGQYGQSSSQTSERRPMLEDSYWCNNRLTTLDLDTAEASSDWGKCNEFAAGSESFGATDQPLPAVVRTIGANSVPSFAPSIVVVSLTGLFVSALAFSSRRAEDEEEVTENLEDDDMAVSPVIATILMVAITVVLSGVIYVWASSLADTDVKGVPRITFDMEDVNGFDVDDGHWRISVQSSETDLATQAVQVRVQYVDGAGAPQVDTYNLADTNGVYGFNPANSDSMVTFVDQVNTEGEDKVSTFNTGDEIFVRTHLADGTPLEDVKITLIYSPGTVGDSGSLLRTWNGLSYNLDA
ncbi:MAG: type IV pilin, partial [Euryarchaeota archaeon]|nr:type IV pilin [Euryarchaeota archaeon]